MPLDPCQDMSTRRFINPAVAADVTPVWIFGSPFPSSTAIVTQGGVGEMVTLADGTIVIRNSDWRRPTQPAIYLAIGPKGKTYATSDATIMPSTSPAAAGGTYSLTWGGNTASGLAGGTGTAATLASALNALASIIAAGGVTVTGAAGGPFTVTFVSNGARASFTSGVNALLPSNVASGYQCVVNIVIVAGGSVSTPAVFTIAPSIASVAALALVIAPNGTVSAGLLGTTVSANSTLALIGHQIVVISGTPQFADLPTGIAPAVVGGVNHLLVAGLFTAYYKSAAATLQSTLALVDMTTGALNGGFAGNSLTLNAGITGTQLLAPKVFSDGADSFGIYNVGSLNVPNTTDTTPLNLVYTQSFTGAVPTGSGTITGVVYNGVTTLSGAVASYGGTGFSGPIAIGSAGGAGTPFSSGIFSIAKPVSSGGKFFQDVYFQRPVQDGTHSGSLLGTSVTGGSYSGGVLSLEIQVPITAGWRVIACGGSTGGNFNLSAPTAAQVLAGIQSLFPECTCAITANASTGILFDVTFSVTRPTGATYLPAINAYYDYFTSGQDVQGPLSFYGIVSSDMLTANYYPLQGPVNGSNTTGPVLNPICSALAVNGSQVCHVLCFAGGTGLNWIITLPGVGRINVSLNTLATLTSQGQNKSENSFCQAPVSVVPFKSGFAIALPYMPVYVGAAANPVNYAANVAAVAKGTVVLSSPIMVIDTALNIDTAFDAACAANFFSVVRGDGARFGPMSLALKDGHLYFGSNHIPTYINTGVAIAQQINSQGDLASPPVWNPFAAAGIGIEVLCACDTSGNKILPATHP